MKISPLDIKKQEFGLKFRGYSPEEVHSYLDMVAAELEEAMKKNLEMEQKVTALEERLASYTRMENILQETLLTTQRSAEETKALAEKKASSMITEANLKAQRVEAETKEKLITVQKEIADLKHQRDTFIVSFRSLLDTQLSLLELLEKRELTKDDFTPIKKKIDLSDEELDEVVHEFEKELREKNNRPRNNAGDVNL